MVLFGTTKRKAVAPGIWLALACALLSGPAIANDAAEPSPRELIEGLVSGRAPVGGPFELIDQTGHRRTDLDFRGKLVVLYFGYTYCPDVCPTELQSISLALDKLGAMAEAVQPLFITVDPERDTPARLAEFVSSFHPRLVGLTGPVADVKKRRSPTGHSLSKTLPEHPASIQSTTPDSSICSARTVGISVSCRPVSRQMKSLTPSAQDLSRNNFT